MSSPASAARRTAASDAGEPTRPATYCFSIQAAAEPGVMARVLALFVKRSLMPCRWHSLVGDRGELQIDIQVADLPPDQGDYIARCLGQIVHVETVLTTRKAAGSPPGGFSAAG